MTEKSQYKIYIDTSDRTESYLALQRFEGENKETVAEKKGQLDVVSSIKELLKENGLTLDEVEVVEANPGPGSFTGLRIGLAVSNILNWVLGKKKTAQMTQPFYGKEPNITPPKKFKLQ
jgi:tRNA A37 threonylcarbamoyladenosine modification protein TsaB